jgi:two-component system response regulator QseB
VNPRLGAEYPWDSILKLLLVEDDDMLGAAMEAGLRQDGHTVDWVYSAESAMAVLHAGSHEAMLLDLGLPGSSGLDVLRWLKRRGLVLPTIIVTARDRIVDRVAGLDAGADDYVVKPVDLDELGARLRAVERRHNGRTTDTVAVGEIAVDLVRKTVMRRSGPVDLTAREFALLEALVRIPGKVVSRQTLQSCLYGFGDEISSNTVEVFIHHLRRKLGDNVVLNVRGRGYRVNVD